MKKTTLLCHGVLVLVLHLWSADSLFFGFPLLGAAGTGALPGALPGAAGGLMAGGFGGLLGVGALKLIKLKIAALLIAALLKKLSTGVQQQQQQQQYGNSYGTSYANSYGNTYGPGAYPPMVGSGGSYVPPPPPPPPVQNYVPYPQAQPAVPNYGGGGSYNMIGGGVGGGYPQAPAYGAGYRRKRDTRPFTADITPTNLIQLYQTLSIADDGLCIARVTCEINTNGNPQGRSLLENEILHLFRDFVPKVAPGSKPFEYRQAVERGLGIPAREHCVPVFPNCKVPSYELLQLIGRMVGATA